MTPSKRRMADVQLQSWFSKLVAGKGEKATPGESTRLPDEPCINAKRNLRAIVVGELASGGTEGIC